MSEACLNHSPCLGLTGRSDSPARRNRFGIPLCLALMLSACGAGGGSAQLPPSSISYSSPAVLTVGAANTVVPTVRGSATRYTISPELPAGLSFDSASGMISGAPRSPATATTYTVTASNESGSTSFTLTLAVNIAAPTGLTYSSPLTGLVDVPLTAAPSVSGAVSSYTVSPALPTGLALDPVSGVISGTPLVASAQGTYTITASNSAGQATFGLSLTINSASAGVPQAPTALSYASPLTALVGVPLTTAPSVNGSATSYAVNPALPSGLALDPGSGVISGTPLAPSAQALYTITASNGTVQSTFVLILTVNPPASTGPVQAPAGLSYASPLTASAGRALTAAPTVSGTVTGYTVSPALPAGLVLDPGSGVISGTPLNPTAQATYIITASNGTAQTVFPLILTINGSSTPIVHLTVMATDPNNYPLTYQWKTTDGSLTNVDGNQADWLLPAGPGEHFGYVLLSNGMGGYAESRVDVNTDSFGLAPATTVPVTYPIPTSSGTAGLAVRLFFSAAAAGSSPLVPVPNESVYLYDGTNDVVSSTSTTDSKGSAGLSLPAASASSVDIYAYCNPINVYGNTSVCYGPTVATTTYAYTPISFLNGVTGKVTLQDGSPCGFRDPFFGVPANGYVNPSVTMQDIESSGRVVAITSATINGFGTFATNNQGIFATDSYQILVQCEGSQAIVPVPASLIVPEPGSAGLVLLQGALPTNVAIPNTAAPMISGMTATYNGSIVASSPGNSPPSSDSLLSNDHFLTFKGSDTQLSACNYYQAIGAATCTSGNITSPISFSDWQQAVGIDSTATNAPPTYVAAYVNVVDLNLTRVHHSVSSGPNQLATYVCNHRPPVDPQGSAIPPSYSGLITTTQQTAIDNAIVNALSGKNKIACVAMDWFATPGVNGGQAFTRFLVFGPNGQLLPSVNLDGRGEKYVPGACVACHGGDHYAGQFSGGSPDVGAHFLPYDTGNFAFASGAALEPTIYQLNQNLLATVGGAVAGTPVGVTPRTQCLIAPANSTLQAKCNQTQGWYAPSSTSIDQNYVAPAWNKTLSTPYDSIPVATTASIYKNVIARNCRTCHAGLPAWDLDSAPLLLNSSNAATSVCGGGANPNLNESMPNSLVTWGRFWAAQGQAQPAAKQAYTYIEQLWTAQNSKTPVANPLPNGCVQQ